MGDAELKEGEMPPQPFSFSLLRADFNEKCKEVTKRTVQTVSEYITSREQLPEFLILMGEAVLVKDLIQEMQIDLSEHSVQVLSVFTPPLVGVLGASLEGKNREDITGERFD